MQWIKGYEITNPGWYWKAWRGANDLWYSLGIVEVSIDALVTSQQYTIPLYASEYMAFFGPLIMPVPPTGDTWGA